MLLLLLLLLLRAPGGWPTPRLVLQQEKLLLNGKPPAVQICKEETQGGPHRGPRGKMSGELQQQNGLLLRLLLAAGSAAAHPLRTTPTRQTLNPKP